MSSQELITRIKRQLSQLPDSIMPFSSYMSSCLYESEFGYYRNDRVKVGREGDFYTSVQVGTIMAEMILKYIEERCQKREWPLSHVMIVEWGSGTGRLASQLLELWSRREVRPAGYAMVETSPYHREQAQQLLQPLNIQSYDMKISWWEEQDVYLHQEDYKLFIIANELLDAFPVERLRRQGDTLEQCYIGWNETREGFEEVWQPATPEVIHWMDEHSIALHDRQIYDAHMAGEAWLQLLWSNLKEAEGLYIDYGDQSEELTATHRMKGTLMCYYRHQAHDNPYVHVGMQDITSYVDFDVYRAAIAKAGGHVEPLISQQQFLVDNGLLEELRQHDARDPFSEAAKRNRAIRQLLLSDQMSERFKVMRVSKL